MSEVLKKFGRYFLLDHVAQGGMAEIYRARLTSPDGAGRLLVIKKVLPGYRANEEFLQMFKSEIKVTMGFNHPNIVQLYDFGEEDGQPYIAMEFVDGRNLRQFVTTFHELNLPFPIEYASYIIEQAASGLHYAHSFKDKFSGEPLNIVHRDISPQNILISFEGTVKVIDFGIAKATTNIESTRVGVIKGKPSYLSPEQLSGAVLDGRSDIFALGAVFWELLTGRKLFAGENELAVLKLIEAAQTYVKPPSTLNSSIPKELDYIVLKSLTKQREQRYQTAEEFQRALHKFIYTFSPDFNPSDLAYRSRELFKAQILADRKKIQALNEKAGQLLNALPLEIPDNKTQPNMKEPTRTVYKTQELSQTKTSGSREVFSTQTTDAIEIEITSNTSANRSPPKPSIKAPEPTPTTTPQPHIPAAARMQTRGSLRPQPTPSSSPLIPLLLLFCILGGIAFGISKLNINFPSPKRWLASTMMSAPPEETVKPLPSPTKNASLIALKLHVIPAGDSAVVFVNNQMVDSTHIFPVELNQSITVSVERVNYKPFKKDFYLDPKQIGNAKEWVMDIPLEPIHNGFLTIHTTPSSDVSFLIDGDLWKGKTPLENKSLPVGDYQIKLTNEILGMEKTVTAKIQEGVSVILDEHLDIKK